MAWYFWRWACWKAFEANQGDESQPDAAAGIVAFVTPTSFLTSRAFDGMREYLRQQCDKGWIINLSPEGNRVPVRTRIFGRGVGRQISIAVFMRRAESNPRVAADVSYLELRGTRNEKLSRLKTTGPGSAEWQACRSGMRSSFRPARSWDVHPALSQLMPTRSRGITSGRSWVYGPTPEILKDRWERFISSDVSRRQAMFHETTRYNIRREYPPLPGFPHPPRPIADESGPCPEPVQVAYRAFDRQWVIPDNRLLAEARAGLWRTRGRHQIFITQQDAQKIETGPGLLFSGLIPDLHHFSGWGGGGVHPMWRDANGQHPNLAGGLLDYLSARLGVKITALDFAGYLAAAVAHRGYTAKFREELEEPGIRVPLSTDAALWRAASTLGQQVIWLHTYGTRCLDSAAGRPQGERPIIEGYGVKCDLAIGALPDRLPDQLDFDAETLRLGEGALSPVARRVIDYDVGGRRVLWRWLNERARRPRLKKRTCAELDDITVPGWNHRLDRELLALLSVLTGCVSIERSQQDLLNQICDGPTISVDELTRANVTFDPPRRLRQHDPGHFDPLELFET